MPLAFPWRKDFKRRVLVAAAWWEGEGALQGKMLDKKGYLRAKIHGTDPKR